MAGKPACLEVQAISVRIRAGKEKTQMATAQTVINWADCPVLESVPGKLGGAWVFRGTRVPYTTVLDNISDLSVNEITESFPTVRRDQIVSFLEFVARSAEPRP